MENIKHTIRDIVKEVLESEEQLKLVEGLTGLYDKRPQLSTNIRHFAQKLGEKIQDMDPALQEVSSKRYTATRLALQGSIEAALGAMHMSPSVGRFSSASIGGVFKSLMEEEFANERRAKKMVDTLESFWTQKLSNALQAARSPMI